MTEERLPETPQEPDPVAKEVGARIRQARRACRLSQTALGSQISLSRSRVHALEQGHVKRLDPALLRRIAEITSQPPDAFYRSALPPSLQVLVQERDVPIELQDALAQLLALPPAHQAKVGRHLASLLSWYQTDVVSQQGELA